MADPKEPFSGETGKVSKAAFAIENAGAETKKKDSSEKLLNEHSQMKKLEAQKRQEAQRERLNRPNFLILMVDEERYPPVYENPELQAWRKKNLLTQDLLRSHGLEFKRHYAGSTACAPSRATLFTGQYPSLHGVTQTDGVAKTAFDTDMFWLDPNTVPTMGNYFRAAGYRTFYKGKWHISEEDILIPGTKNSLPSYNTTTGVPDPEKEKIYLFANRLDRFGFNGWIGPEPHGREPHNSGSSAAVGVSGRDVVYSREAVDLIRALDKQQTESSTELPPWLIVASFVNPHDITLFGAITRLAPAFNFTVDPSVPPVPPAPTATESLSTKPRAQRSYREVYPKAFQPLRDSEFYRRLYYQLQKNSDRDMLRVFETLQRSSFYNNTIVIFTSDHGDLLGAHGGLFQKWYCAYEEALHVPLIMHNPVLFNDRKSVEILTSHVDILPTMLGLAGADVNKIQEKLHINHTEVHPLVGRDFTPLILGEGKPQRAGEPLFFMTDDDITRGPNQVTVLGQPYNSVVQPNHLLTVIADIQTDEGKQTWKYSCYYDNPQFWSDPGTSDEIVRQADDSTNLHNGVKASLCITSVKTQPVPEQFEMYNLTEDPLETKNLAHPQFATPETKIMQRVLANLLEEQCRQKRLAPTSGTVPGMPSCGDICQGTNLIFRQSNRLAVTGSRVPLPRNQ